ncbi:hypothetical protein CBM2587_P20017 [Cupriavidus taiwanensis]|uniref:Uncharacterized protein n=1 Tax=Cupriavidus taiwanensis TaxID=164546 RepID=A0A375CJP9_9BURK|nr:hypothetical protein CBM2587_P20017 [Cupriavidus taiwanensis]
MLQQARHYGAAEQRSCPHYQNRVRAMCQRRLLAGVLSDYHEETEQASHGGHTDRCGHLPAMHADPPLRTG